MMTVKPKRLRLSRAAGFDLQAASRALNGLGAVNVARPSRFGNPRKIGLYRGYGAREAVRDYRLWLERALSVRSFEGLYGRPPSIDEIVSALGGKNLACWCAPDAPCHADVLLELANPEIEGCKA